MDKIGFYIEEYAKHPVEALTIGCFIIACLIFFNKKIIEPRILKIEKTMDEVPHKCNKLRGETMNLVEKLNLQNKAEFDRLYAAVEKMTDRIIELIARK